jgi:hypothetical protein
MIIRCTHNCTNQTHIQVSGMRYRCHGVALRCVCVPWLVACAVLSGSSAVSRCMATVYLARLQCNACNHTSYNLFSPNCQPMYPLAMSGMCTPEIVVEKNRLACLHLRCCGFGCGNRSGRCDAEAKAWMHTWKSNLEVKYLLCNARHWVK